MTDTTLPDMRQQMEHAGIDPSTAAQFTEAQMAVIQRKVDETAIQMALAVSLQAIAGLRWQTEQWMLRTSGDEAPEDPRVKWYDDRYTFLELEWSEWAYAELAKIAEKYAGGEGGSE
jgi:hypothetical protein